MSTDLEVPALQGEGATLRPWRPDDLPTVRAAARDPFIPLITTVPAGGSDDECAAYLDRQWQKSADGRGWSFAIAEDTAGPAVGHIGLWPAASDRGRADTGYWLLASARGRGLGARALRVLASWAVDEQGIDRLQLVLEPWNVASRRTAEGAGFVREALLRRYERVGDERRDMEMYALLAHSSANGAA
jgi:[ribosomal protein S5]-alanine N-acetyltransferase